MMDSNSLLIVKWVFASGVRITNEFNFLEDIFTSEIFVVVLLYIMLAHFFKDNKNDMLIFVWKNFCA